MNISIAISLLALLISIGTLVHTLYRGVTQSQLELSKARADLLTQLVELKLEYEQEVREFTRLLDMAKGAGLNEADDLQRIVNGFKGFIISTQGHYDALMAAPKIPRNSLEDLRHRVEALRARVKSETSQLHERTARLQQQLEGASRGET